MNWVLKLTFALIILLNVRYASGQNQAEQSCNQKSPFKNLEKKLDSIICIPEGYIIVHLETIDVDLNGSKDKIIRWFKDYPRIVGDTTYHSIYLSNNDELYLYKSYSNISPLFFDLKSRSSRVNLEDSLLNEIKYIFGNALNTVPRFKKGVIILEFEIAAREYIKLYFTISKSRNTFVLTKQEIYNSTRSDGLDKKLKSIKTFTEQDGLDIEKFDYLDFIYY